MAAPVQKLIDPETLEFLDRQREGDMKIVVDIGAEQKHIEFRYGHAERFNAWKSEELHIDRANFKETALLEKIHDEEEASMVAHQVKDTSCLFFVFPVFSIYLSSLFCSLELTQL